LKHRPIHFERQREYPMSVDEAWRLLADTNHLNRTVGLPAVSFSPLDGTRGEFTRGARARAFGIVPLSWTEYPFDWVRNRSYRVRREFHRGPLAVLEGGIELEPAGERVKVKAFADYTPANWTGRFLWRLGNATVTDLLAFCDQYLSRRGAGKPDPVPVPRRRPAVDHAQLERALANLRTRPVREELIPQLRERILEGADDQVVGIRPFALARTWGADRLQVLRLFLYATRAGLFELRWEVMCPNCRVPKAESAALAQLPNQFHCETCGIGYGVDFDQRVELRFTIHPGIRQAADGVYCIGGPLRMPHVVAQQYLRPQEDRELDLDLQRPLRLRAVAGARTLDLVPGPGDGRTNRVRITYAEGRWVGPHSLATPDEDRLTVPSGASIVLRNQTNGRLLVVVEEVDWDGDETTAAQVTALQEFRDLFSGEVLAPGQQLAVRDIAFVFSDLKGSTSLYEGVGDARAYSRVNRHFEFIRHQIVEHGGSVVKTMGDAVMGAFFRLDDAAAAALGIQREIGPWCESQAIDPPLVLKTGLHHGPVIAVNANGHLDYFGRTVNVAARLSAESSGGDLFMLQEVLAEVGSLPDEVALQHFRARLRGLDGEREIVRVRLRGAPA
jgi:adenylate cyclase